ncbi:uncharacterized protein LOC129286535 [Prosopis cineraria]|uniref:uncharacterized protein LOC129286535 n=1 Tax=Prosopis cineraria TaxID=364024 RepID=UPI0024104F6D|nr:uncharacterized protein LOC129286535 [Prosopis cineraria]
MVKNQDGSIHYEGGRAKRRAINEGTTLEELKRIIRSCIGLETNILEMKYTIKPEMNTLVDLEDDEGVANLIEFNDGTAHVYIVGNDVSNIDMVTESHEGLNELNHEPESIPLSMSTAPAPLPELNAVKWKDLLYGVRQMFHNAVEFRQVLYKFSIGNKFCYSFVKNNTKKVIVKCKVDGCKWRVSAYAISETSPVLRVTSLCNEHAHSAQDTLVVQQKANVNLTSSIIIDELKSNVDKTPNEIRRDLYQEFGLTLTYSQAYRGKERAMEELHGAPEDSYKLIPWICQRLTEKDVRTIAKWTACRDNRFERLFIAYGCCIDGFLNGCRPILYVDGCHLSGPYKGTLLSASADDADNDLFPVAYAIVSGEKLQEWTWFMHNLKDIMGSLEVTIVSDRHNAIIGAVGAVFGGNRHAFCYRHIKENFSAEFVKIGRRGRRATTTSKEDALKLLDAIAYARIDLEFNRAMGNLRAFCPELAQWLETNGDINRWALSKFPFCKWDNITNNLSESFNA